MTRYASNRTKGLQYNAVPDLAARRTTPLSSFCSPNDIKGVSRASMTTRIPNILSIAGVDPSGGAGILADIKAMSALGGYGMAVVAALTAQSTLAVTAIHPVPQEFVAQQIDTLFDDVRVDAVKIGMLGQQP